MLYGVETWETSRSNGGGVRGENEFVFINLN